ncbi:oligosaccharide flippase family protein [Alteromonas naphthalenivorans]|uniref:ATPase n=1 Tax=Alteromonas naphthalenivorans TaxID=715451 RepID=F5ZC38_ALTNA|nr:oligosaccharide flippase family protein [Alteromonas naphthalenivorans]AEF02276.1 ATPase [Alteromonas naphthalenivorans]
MSLGNTAKKGLKVGLSLGVFGQLLSWISTLFVVRILYPEDFAFLAISEMVVGFALMLSKLGFFGALIRKKELSDGDLNAIFSLLMLISCSLYLLLFIFSDTLEALLDKPGVGELILVNGILILISPFQLIYLVLLNREMNFTLIAKIQVFITIIQSLVNLVLAYYGFGYWSIIYSLLFSQILTLLLFRQVCRKYLRLSLDFKKTKDIWEDVNSSFFTAVIWDVNSRLDVFFIQSFYASSILGFYRMSKTISEKPVSLVSKVVQSITLATFSKVASDKLLLAKYIKDSVFFAVFISAPLFVGLSMTAENFVPLILGAKWIPAIDIVKVLCLMQVVNSLKEISGIGLFAAGNGKRKVVQAALALGITATAWLIGGQFSITIALLLVFIGESIWYVLHVQDSKRYLELGGFFREFKAPAVSTGVMAIAIFSVDKLLGLESNIIELICKIITGVLTYFVTLKLFENSAFMKFKKQLLK